MLIWVEVDRKSWMKETFEQKQFQKGKKQTNNEVDKENERFTENDEQRWKTFEIKED